MKQAAQQDNQPPKLKKTATGETDINSLADLLEWFLTFDERTARMRHTYVEELFQWKQKDDEANGVNVYPFENAEARFAIGVFQALGENNTEKLLQIWITDLLNALQDARQAKNEIEEMYNLHDIAEKSALEKAAKLSSEPEKRYYLTSSWIEALCTAEIRFLGFVYQEMYDKAFQPGS